MNISEIFPPSDEPLKQDIVNRVAYAPLMTIREYHTLWFNQYKYPFICKLFDQLMEEKKLKPCNLRICQITKSTASIWSVY